MTDGPQALQRHLAHEFQLIDEPTPGTLRLRIALVELKRSGGSGGEPVGSVALELEVLDAVSGRRLVAVADSRGEGAARGESNATDVRAAFDEWARRARDRLATFRDFDSIHAGGAARP